MVSIMAGRERIPGITASLLASRKIFFFFSPKNNENYQYNTVKQFSSNYKTTTKKGRELEFTYILHPAISNGDNLERPILSSVSRQKAEEAVLVPKDNRTDDRSSMVLTADSPRHRPQGCLLHSSFLRTSFLLD